MEMLVGPTSRGGGGDTNWPHESRWRWRCRWATWVEAAMEMPVGLMGRGGDGDAGGSRKWRWWNACGLSWVVASSGSGDGGDIGEDVGMLVDSRRVRRVGTVAVNGSGGLDIGEMGPAMKDDEASLCPLPAKKMVRSYLSPPFSLSSQALSCPFLGRRKWGGLIAAGEESEELIVSSLLPDTLLSFFGKKDAFPLEKEAFLLEREAFPLEKGAFLLEREVFPLEKEGRSSHWRRKLSHWRRKGEAVYHLSSLFSPSLLFLAFWKETSGIYLVLSTC